MKIFICLFLFSYFVFAQTVVVDDNLEEFTLSSQMQYLKTEPHNSILPNQVSNHPNLLSVSNPNFGQNFANSIWSVVKIQQNSLKTKRVYLLNPLILIEFVDVYVYENEKLIQKFDLGLSRAGVKHNTSSRFVSFYIDLKPNVSYSVVTKYTNPKGRIDIEWIVMSQNYFEQFLFNDFFIWGIILGSVFLIFILHALFYFTLKNRSFLGYLIYIFLLWVYLFTNNGFMAYFIHHGEFNSILAHISGYSMLVYYVIFLDDYLGLSKNNKYKYLLVGIYVYSTYLAMTSWVIAFSTFVYSFDDYYFIITGFVLVIMFLITTKEIVLNRSIFGFYLFGQIFLLSGFMFLCLNSFQIIPTKTYNQQFVGIFALAEMVFFAIAVLAKIRQSIDLKEKNDRLILSQSHFSTIGQTLRNIAHQWKVPTVRLGALITELEATFYKMKIDNQRVDEIFENMRNSTDFMQNTIHEFSNFYSSDTQSSGFSLRSQIDDIKMLLLEKMNFLNFNIACDKSLDETFIVANPRTFGHICMIIIDNAIEIAQQRNVKNANIKIYSFEDQNGIEIIFEDNCNGIFQKPINVIFELEVSSHKEKNRGSGLAIAKMLVESKIGGKIEVENTKVGAKFKIWLPRKT